MLSHGLIAAIAVVGALIVCAALACTVWWCCCRSRHSRSGATAWESTKTSLAGRELSADPLALSGTPLTALSKSGNIPAGDDDGLVGVNYVRAKYHDSSGLHDEEQVGDSSVLWLNVMSWMCGSRMSSVRFLLFCAVSDVFCSLQRLHA